MVVAGKLTGRRGKAVLVAALAVMLIAVCARITQAVEADQAAPAAAAGLGPGQVGSRSAVPWRQVGGGWALAQYWPGRFGWDGNVKAAAATLYLIDPGGGRYRLYTWPVTKNPPYLVGWSGDKTRALVRAGDVYEQVVLATGKASRFRLGGRAEILGYTRPAGRDLLGWRQAGSRSQISRYDLSGHLDKVLATGTDLSAVYSGTGATLAVTGSHGIRLIGSDGSAVRNLEVPGATGAGCSPSRWWDAGRVLASCVARGTRRGRLWLVPADGSRPTALAPQHPALNEIGAWRLPGGLYLQTVGSSGRASIFRQAAGGSVRLVTVPGSALSHWIVAASGPRLLLTADNPCAGSTSLLWFSSSTRHEQMLLQAPHGLAGVLGAVPYGPPGAQVFIAFGCP